MTKNDKQPHTVENFCNIPRCGAKTRSGKSCKNPCVKGKKRCRMHGGAVGSGAPKGNKNAWKHGNRSAVAILQHKEISQLLRDLKKQIEAIELQGESQFS